MAKEIICTEETTLYAVIVEASSCYGTSSDIGILTPDLKKAQEFMADFEGGYAEDYLYREDDYDDDDDDEDDPDEILEPEVRDPEEYDIGEEVLYEPEWAGMDDWATAQIIEVKMEL